MSQHNILFGAAMVLLALCGWGLWNWAMAPIPVASVSYPRQESSSPQRDSVPADLLVAARAVATFYAPTPISPTPSPTYEPLPTPLPVAVCLTSTPKGETCVQPPAPLPTATPTLPCPVRPGKECIYPGGAVTWLTATPTPAAKMTSGSSS